MVLKIPVPGEKLLIRMWETVADKGIGSLFRPWAIRREGKALNDVRREERLLLAQAERDADEIRAGRKQLMPGTTVVVDAPVWDTTIEGVGTEPPLADRLRQQVLADTFRREVNVTKALIAAEEQLRDDEQEPPERQPDTDWLFRWRDYAGAVSSDELQTLWGRLLAGEVKSPGAFSLRTLEFLRNLSSIEANDIARLSPFVVNNNFIFNHETVLASEGVTFGYLLSMQQLGILSGVDATGLQLSLQTISEGTFLRLLPLHNRALVVTVDDPTKTLSLPVRQVTAVGRELLSLGKFEPNDRYLRTLIPETT